jgi:hypothetical protein
MVSTDNSGKIHVNSRGWTSNHQESKPTYGKAEHFLRCIDKYVSCAVGNHYFLQWSKYPQLRRAPKELPESSQGAPRELPSPSLSEICVFISLSKTADKLSFLGKTWRFKYGERQMVQIPSCVTLV